MTNAICSIEECSSPAKAGRGWCWKHYNRFRRNGDPSICKHWKESDPRDFHIGYGGAHDRVKARYGSASDHACVDCGAGATDWSCDNPTVSDESGRSYSLDPGDYSPRCRPCHRVKDGAVGLRALDTCLHGHPYDAANTGIKANGHRWCRACNVERLRNRRSA